AARVAVEVDERSHAHRREDRAEALRAGASEDTEEQHPHAHVEQQAVADQSTTRLGREIGEQRSDCAEHAKSDSDHDSAPGSVRNRTANTASATGNVIAAAITPPPLTSTRSEKNAASATTINSQIEESDMS